MFSNEQCSKVRYDNSNIFFVFLLNIWVIFFLKNFFFFFSPCPLHLRWLSLFICLCPTKKNYLSNVLAWWLSLAVRDYFSIQRAREGKNKDRVAAEATFRFGASRETTTEQLNNSTMGNQTDWQRALSVSVSFYIWPPWNHWDPLRYQAILLLL